MFNEKDIEEKTYTVEEYFELEELADGKFEYHAGKLYAMTGGTLKHGILSGNMLLCLNEAVEKSKKRCLPLNNDIKVHVPRNNHFVYPDAMMVCGEVETYDQDQNAITNPVLVVEVLSKSTSHYDRGEKFRKYCSLPSFKEYLLIDLDSPVVDTLYRGENGYWIMMTTIELGKAVKIHCLDTEIPMASIYKNVPDLHDPQINLDV